MRITPRHHRRLQQRGFTLIELFISISILLFISVLILPQWSGYRAKQDANQVAQEIAGTLKQLSANAARYETCYFISLNSTSGYTTYTGTQTYGGSYAASVSKVRDWSREYGRARITNPSSGSGRITYGPRGWVVDATTIPAAASAFPTTLSSTADFANGPYYTITVSSDSNDASKTFSVIAYLNGTVKVTNANGNML